MASGPQDIPLLIAQVRKCLDLAQLAADREIAENLMMLAARFAQRAIELGAAPEALPPINPLSICRRGG